MPFNKTITSVYAQLTDWLNEGAGSVSDPALVILNKAQNWLWGNAEWEYLVREQSLTLTDKAVTLPSNFGRVINIQSSSDSTTGKPDKYFAKDKHYKIRGTYSNLTGHSFIITFFEVPEETPKLLYQVLLSDFTDSDTDFSFFDPDLLLLTAQVMRARENGLDANEYKILKSEHIKQLSDYTRKHQYVNSEMKRQINDTEGNEIIIPDFNLDGE